MADVNNFAEDLISGKDDVYIYYAIKRPPKALSATIDLIDYYPEVSQEDVDRGSVTRYFVRQVNHAVGDITEIDYKTHRKIQNNPLYKTVALEWKISGKLDDVLGPNDINTPVRLYTGVRTSNRLAVEQAEHELPGIRYKLMDLTKFWVNTEDT